MSEPEVCPRLMEVRARWDGEIHGEAVEDLLRHLEGCRVCRDEDREIARFNGLLKDGDVETVLPAFRRAELRAAVLAACEPEPVAAGWLAWWGRHRSGGEPRATPRRRVAWTLVPVAAVLVLVGWGRLHRSAQPGAFVAEGGSGAPNGPAATPRRAEVTPVPAGEGPEPGDSRKAPRRPPPLIEKRRIAQGPSGGPGRRSGVRLAPSLRVHGGGLPGGQSEPRETKRPSRPDRVADHRRPSARPVLRERLVVQAEGSAPAPEMEAPSGSIQIIASGGRDTPAGQVAIVQIHEQGDRP